MRLRLVMTAMGFVMSSAALVACGEDTPAVCGSAEQLQSSFDDLKDIDITETPVEKDDVYLLCSDGLSDMVDATDIQLTLNTFGANLETVARQLVQLSNDNGGRDNVSVVLVRVLDAFQAQRGIIGRILGMFG